jgi:hypothetical protein
VCSYELSLKKIANATGLSLGAWPRVREAVRGDVDAFLLDLLEDRTFTARDFGELPNGVCRIAGPLMHELALTLPHWRECLRPIAARLAQAFRASLTSKGATPRSVVTKSTGKRTAPGPRPSPLLATPRKASQRRPYATRAWRAATIHSRPANPGDVRRAGAQAQAPSLRGVHAQGAPRGWPPRESASSDRGRRADRPARRARQP